MLLLQNIYIYGLEFAIDVNAWKQINGFVYAHERCKGLFEGEFSNFD
jgi:hypothetical protein